MGSLREFEALREGTTEWDFLCPIDGHTEEQSKWPFQVLPYTLRTLKPRDKPIGDRHDYVGCYKELVQGLVLGKESAFSFFESLQTFDVPQGKTFESRACWTMEPALRRICEDVDIVLTFRD